MGEPLVRTERLDLWLPKAGDIEPIYAIVSHEETRRFLGPEPDFSDHFQRFLRGAGSWQLFGYGFFMVRLKSSGKPIGNCGIFRTWRGLGEDFDDAPEAGWILAAEHTGKGLAHEAMRAAFAWFEGEHGRQRVTCMISPRNTPSIALAHKLGFAPMRKAELPDGDTVVLFERVPA